MKLIAASATPMASGKQVHRIGVNFEMGLTSPTRDTISTFMYHGFLNCHFQFLDNRGFVYVYGSREAQTQVTNHKLEYILSIILNETRGTSWQCDKEVEGGASVNVSDIVKINLGL